LKVLGLKRDGLAFHSFRHTVAGRLDAARDFQAEGLCEEMIEIARDTSGDDAGARLRIKALERQVARMAPRKSWALKG